MNIELLIIGILILVGGIIIFKLIKKLLVAAISFIALIVLVIAGLGGLIYYDITSLANQQEYVLHVELMDDNFQQAGFTLPFENGTADFNQLGSFEEQEKYSDSQSHIVFEKESFYSTLEEKTVSLNSFELLEDYDNELSGEQYLEILESNQPIVSLVDTLYANYSMPENIKEQSKAQAREEINNKIEELEISPQDFLFALGFTSLVDDKKTYLELFMLYKEGKIEIEPETISMKFISYIPTQFVTNTLNNETSQ